MGKCAGKGEEVRGLRSIQNSQGDVRYSIGNREAKELILHDHGHEQWCGDYLKE